MKLGSCRLILTRRALSRSFFSLRYNPPDTSDHLPIMFWLNISRYRWTRELLSAPNNIPNNADQSKAYEDYWRIIHTDGRSRDSRWHTKQHNSQQNPRHSYQVDDETNSTKRKGRMSNSFSTPNQRNKDRDPIRYREADCGNSCESVEGTCRCEIDAAKYAIDNSSQYQAS
jgi:hypothetical protein